MTQPITVFAVHGSYDKRHVYTSLHLRSPYARVLIPPRKNARIWQYGITQAERPKRDENLRDICQQSRRLENGNPGITFVP